MNVFHRICWKLAHKIGWVRQRLSVRWVPPLSGFLLVIVLIVAVDYILAKVPFPPLVELNKNWNHKLGDWLNIWTILAIYTISWLLIWSVQARSRMVVENFTNYAGKDFEDAANGISMILLVMLGQLHDLYQTVDDQRAISTTALDHSALPSRYLSIDATLNVDNIEAFLKDAICTQSTLNVGPLKIPIGILMSLIGHVAQGPRIIGSLHKDKNQDGKSILILNAQSMRQGKSFTWRVEREFSSEQPTSIDLNDLIDEFACRIFTDMALSSTVRWRAASVFVEGLRAYRECLRTPKDRIKNLQLAEDKFIETLTEDTQYTLAHYNLGVVLTELQRKEAAISSFERAVIENPRSCQAYYALALSCYQEEQYYRASQLCKRVIELKPDPGSIAKAYQLRAMALAALKESSNTILAFRPSKAMKSCNCAIRYARKALYRAEIAQQDDVSGSNDRVLKAETLLGLCISTLAKIYLPELLAPEKSLAKAVNTCFSAQENHHLEKTEQLLRTALRLRSTDASYDSLYHWALGRVCYAQKNYKEASQHARIAVRAAPDRVEYLADLLLSHANTLAKASTPEGNKTLDLHYEEYLFQTLLDLTSVMKNDASLSILDTALQAYEQKVLPEAHYEDKHSRIKMIQAFLQLGCDFSKNTSLDELKQRYDDFIKPCSPCNGKCQTCLLGRGINNTSTSVQQQQNAKISNQINKILCISQVVFAMGSIHLQLGRDKQTAANYHLQQLQGWLSDLGNRENDLVKQLADQKEIACEWEHGQILRILATLYFEVGKRKQETRGPLTIDLDPFNWAVEYYNRAITILSLGKKYHRGISVQNLRSSLASVLLQLPGQQQVALQVAQESITLDAMNYKNYEILGDVYYKCEDFSNAIEVWQQAVARKNTTAVEINDPDLYMKLGRTYVALAQSRHSICLSDQQCREAERYLEHALKCCTNEHVSQRLQIYCSLGYLHSTREDYDQAVKYLRLTQSFGFAPCTSTFYLAYAYLRMKNYDGALKQFRSLQEKAEALQGDATEILEVESGSHICLNEMRALAFWGQAYTLTERDVYPKDLLHLAEQACEMAKKVPLEKLLFPSRYVHCKGWILYKLHKLEPLEKSNGTGTSQMVSRKKAIEILLEAVKLEAKPEIYLHLAQAYQDELTDLSSPTEKLWLLTNIRTYYWHARDLNSDNDELINRQLDELFKSLPT